MSKKQSKIEKTNAIRQVERAKINYTTHHYPWKEDEIGAEHVAEALQKDPHTLYKTIVTVGKQTGPVVAVLPGDEELDLKALAKASGNKKIELLHLKDLETTTGYIRGGCSPVGMKKLFPTYIAQEAETLDEITVSAGKRGLQISLHPHDLAQLVHAKFAQISIPKKDTTL